MRKSILLLYAALTCFTNLWGQTYYMPSPEGFGAAATGGGNAAPVTVSTYADFKTAWTSSAASVILVSGTIDFSSSGMIKAVVKNKTLIGLPGAKFTNTNQSVSGILYLQNGSDNVIIRNMLFVGPGAWDNNGNDNLTADGCTNLWVDHCEFQDGEDGNFDNKGNTDNVTISWCKFTYFKAPRPAGSGTTDDHRFTNLIGSNASDAPADGHFSITFSNCYWADGCRERMPRSRNGELHLLNCYYNTNVSSSLAIGLGGGSNNLSCYVENCDFAKIGSVFKNYSSSDGGSVALTFSGCINGGTDLGTVTKPSYKYTVYPAATVASAVPDPTCGAGATLKVSAAGVISSGCPVSNNVAPVVSLTSPVNNGSTCQGTAVALAGTASDADGSISKVEFYDGTTLLATVTASPYTYSWTTAATGSHTITAKATDNAGAITTSSSASLTVNALPTAPSVNTPVTYCQGATTTALTATGTSLKWYATASGGTGSTTAPTPSASTAGTTSYYVSQTINGCEGARAAIAVTVNAAPAAPTVTTPVIYCQGATTTALTATGASLKWYTTASGGTGSTTAPTPSAGTAGTTSYYVSQTINGCEGVRAAIAVTVNAAPAAPTVTTPVTYCQGATPTALTATGTALKWYATASGGTGSTTAPTPSAGTAGTTSYYVSQTINGCEGARAAIAVTVNAAPAAPTVTTPVTYCQGATPTALTATGTALKWYTTASGGTGSTTAPTPSAGTPGTTSYYVSQTMNGCEGPRAAIAVTINPMPVATITAGGPTTFIKGGSVDLIAPAGNGLSYQWYRNDTLLSGNTNYSYTATTGGSYMVTVTNISDCKATSSPEVVTVHAPDNQVPEVSITVPAANASFVAPASVNIGANATDPDGSIAKVEFYHDGVLLGTDSNYPYSFTWTGVAAGSYLLTAIAYDNSNASTVSSGITIQVRVNQPSLVQITAPDNNSTITGTSVTIQVTASDPDGSIVSVDYYDGTTLIGSGTDLPYAIVWNNPGAGDHTLTVKVTDSNGGVTVSDPVAVTVSSATAILPVSGYVSGLKVYPNPSHETFMIQATENIAGIRILNAFGQEVNTLSITDKSSSIETGLELPEGIYVLILEYASGKREVAKLVKTK